MRRLAEAIGQLLKVHEGPCRIHDFMFRMTRIVMHEFQSEADFLALMLICIRSLNDNIDVQSVGWKRVMLCAIIWIDKMHNDYSDTSLTLLPRYYSKKQIESLEEQSLMYSGFFPALITSDGLRDAKQEIHGMEIPKIVICKGYDDEDAVMVSLQCDEVMMY